MPAKKTRKQTLTGIIRSRVPTYQARQLAGELQKTFAEELTAEGHPTSYDLFRVLYLRARKQLKAGETQSNQPTSERPKERIETKNEKSEVPESGTSHRPVDLDEIARSNVDLQALARIAKRNRK